MEMLEWVEAFGDYVPLFQTLVWIVLIVLACILFRTQARKILETIIFRIETGSSLKAGPLELGSAENLRRVEQEKSTGTNAVNENSATVNARIQHRRGIYEENRGVFIAYIVTPSKKVGQKFDVYIYLIRHSPSDTTPADLSDVVKADFFFGSYWGNQIFEASRAEEKIGIITSAYGSFLCTCLVQFRDGHQVLLDRYVDFEMANLFFSQTS